MQVNRHSFKYISAQFAVLLCLVIVSCEKVVEFRGDEQSPVVVVVSEPEPDATMAVRLTYSRFFLSGGNFKVIGNADVKVSVAGTTYSGVFNDSAYVFPYSPNEGDSIELSIRMRNGGEDTVLTAGTRIPFRPNITLKQPDGAMYHFTLNDRPGERNYYRLRVQMIDTVVVYYDSVGRRLYDPDDSSIVVRDTARYIQWCGFGCSDAVLTTNVSTSFDIEGEDSYYELFFTDELFDGQRRDITIKCDGDSYYYDDYDYYKHRATQKAKNVRDAIYLYIESLSKEAYLYELSRSKQLDEDFFLTEPVQVQCNVVGGIGIFGGKATSVVRLQQDEN